MLPARMATALILLVLAWPGSADVPAESGEAGAAAVTQLSPQVALHAPEATVTTLHDGLITLARQHRDSDLAARYEALRPLIVATHDLDFIAQFAIRRQWNDLSAEQQSRFRAAFERLSVMTYASRFANVAADTFAPISAAGGSETRVQIASVIRRADDADIPMEYVLHEQAGAWRIINIVADGVSDLALKRAEYQRVIGDAGIAGLISHLEAQTERLVQDGQDRPIDR
jgi:phospholipid transport system substrate-binding protein